VRGTHQHGARAHISPEMAGDGDVAVQSHLPFVAHRHQRQPEQQHRDVRDGTSNRDPQVVWTNPPPPPSSSLSPNSVRSLSTSAYGRNLRTLAAGTGDTHRTVWRSCRWLPGHRAARTRCHALAGPAYALRSSDPTGSATTPESLQRPQDVSARTTASYYDMSRHHSRRLA